MKPKQIPLGLHDFRNIISQNYYFVDKSLLIKELLDGGIKVTLLPRPRRFGKTLNLSMLQYFFEKTPESHAHLFNNLLITHYPAIMKHQGTYPVIFLTFKGIKSTKWTDCFEDIKAQILAECIRHRYLLVSNLLAPEEKRNLEEILNKTAPETSYKLFLKNLSEYLYRFHGKEPIILIDEYDTPINTAFSENYYDDCISFMRALLGDGLKDNKYLSLSVITGILRISKESIFSDLNNLEVCSMTSDHYADKFGLLEDDVTTFLSYYGLSHELENVKIWYNGYLSGKYFIYNPWSILSLARNNGKLEPYWINTSSNTLVKQLVQKSSLEIKEDFEQLIQKKIISRIINENFVFPELATDNDLVWNLLFHSGYLTAHNIRRESDGRYADFLIPNEEVLDFFKASIRHWFERAKGISSAYQEMLKALITGDVTTFSHTLSDIVMQSLSSFDVSGKEPERFYHGLTLGMLLSLMDQYEVKSNKESGSGRYDVMLIPFDITKRGIILEFKKVQTHRGETLTSAADVALQQINQRGYEAEMHARKITTILKLGIAFEGKRVFVKEGR